MTTTKDKLEFVHAMSRHTQATVRQCEALMRFATTLQRLAEDQCNIATDDAGQKRRDAKKLRIANKVIDLCGEITGSLSAELLSKVINAFLDVQHDDAVAWFQIRDDANAAMKVGACVPIFSSDPRGAVLKIRVPSGYANDFGGEGICVPS